MARQEKIAFITGACSLPAIGLGGVWPLYAASNVDGTFNAETFPLWVYNQDDGNVYWIQANLTNEPTWGAWSVFQPLPQGDLGIAAMAASQLPDGRFQLFASDQNGFLYSIWQDTSGNWLPSWQTNFPQPGSGQILVGGSNSIFWPNGLPYNLTLSMTPLPDGRSQLFAIDASGDVWSAWKTSTDPDAGWTSWSAFG